MILVFPPLFSQILLSSLAHNPTASSNIEVHTQIEASEPVSMLIYWLSCVRQTSFTRKENMHICTFLFEVKPIQTSFYVFFFLQMWVMGMYVHDLKTWFDVSWVFTAISPEADNRISLKIIPLMKQTGFPGELTWCDWDWMKSLHSQSRCGGSADPSWIKTCFTLRYVCLYLPFEETSILGLKSNSVRSLSWREFKWAPEISGTS